MTEQPGHRPDEHHSIDATDALDLYASGSLTASDIEHREVLAAKMRRVVAMTALLAQNRMDGFAAEVRGAVEDGMTPSDLLETLHLVSHHGIQVPLRAVHDVRNACRDR